MKKKFIILLAIFSMLSLNAFAEENVSVLVNGESVVFDVEPREVEGSILVPFRAVFEKMGYEVSYIPGEKPSVCAEKEGEKIDFEINSDAITYNGVEFNTNAPTVIIEDRTMFAINDYAYVVGLGFRYTYSDNVINIVVPNELKDQDVLDICLDGNPTTGYQWSVAEMDKDMVEVESEYVADKTDEALSGVGGTYHFKIKGLKEGFATVRMEYARSWEDESIQKCVCDIYVSSDLKVTLLSENNY